MEDFFLRFKSFGCATQEIDGNSISAILSAIETAKKITDRPSLILSHTIKGKGISFMENDNNWHYRTPNKIELEKAHLNWVYRDAKRFCGRNYKN